VLGLSHHRGVLFGAAAAVGGVLDSIADKCKAFVVDFAAVPLLDSTAANAMGRVAAKASRQGIRLFITGASPTRPASAAHPWREPAACTLSRDDRACGGRYQGQRCRGGHDVGRPRYELGAVDI
jgi:MFS superfamily sulfate permease-like transporter